MTWYAQITGHHWSIYCHYQWFWKRAMFYISPCNKDSLEKTLMLGKIEDRRRKGWQRMRWLDGITDRHEFEQDLGSGEGQGGQACCSTWGRKELDTTELLNWTDTRPHQRQHISKIPKQIHVWQPFPRLSLGHPCWQQSRAVRPAPGGQSAHTVLCSLLNPLLRDFRANTICLCHYC